VHLVLRKPEEEEKHCIIKLKNRIDYRKLQMKILNLVIIMKNKPILSIKNLKRNYIMLKL